MNMNDTQLISRYAEDGDHAAFEELVKRYVDVAYSAAMIRLGKDDLARDTCQTTFLELATKAAKLPPDINLGGWVYSTARNMARKIQRTDMRRMQRELSYVEQMKTQPINQTDWSRLAPDIHDALDKLKTAERDAIILRFFQNKNLVEVGNVMGISTDAARMRINRALERLNAQLVKKGVTSTAAALAAALPAHASLTAPAGLSAAISTSVMAVAGTGIATTTLTGAAIAIMKTKALLITAVAATVVIGGSAYLSSTTEATRTTSDQVQTSNNRTNGEVKSVESYRHTEPMTGLKHSGGKSVGSLSGRNTIEIDPEYLEKAEQMISMTEISLKFLSPYLSETTMAEDPDNLTLKLQLRMGMNSKQTTRFNEILTAYADDYNRTRWEQTEKSVQVMSDLMKEDREGMVEYMALEGMVADGETLTPEQATYHQSLKERLEPRMEATDEGLLTEWYENDEILNELFAQLNLEQKNELNVYLDEQRIRKREEKALTRANALSNSLGLNEADRAALYGYLYEHPEASNNDVSEQLAPELRNLMPSNAPY